MIFVLLNLLTRCRVRSLLLLIFILRTCVRPIAGGLLSRVRRLTIRLLMRRVMLMVLLSGLRRLMAILMLSDRALLLLVRMLMRRRVRFRSLRLGLPFSLMLLLLSVDFRVIT